MDNRPSFFHWAPWIFAVLLSVFVGIGAYNAGVTHQVVVATAPAAGAPAQIVMPYYGWHFGWHPFGFVFPLFFFLFIWFGVARFVFWGRYRRGCDGYPGASGPSSFDEWHRQAHERMNTKST
jgi:hypothetical protein